MTAIGDLQGRLRDAFRADDGSPSDHGGLDGHRSSRTAPSTTPRLDIDARTDLRPVIRVGLASTGLCLVGFLVWASLFPLSSAIVTLGTFVADGRNKAVQHERGGRVVAVHTRDGATVKAGDAVVTLDADEARAELTRLSARHAALKALRQRLDAQRSGRALDMSPDAGPAGILRLRDSHSALDRRATGSLRLSGGRFVAAPADEAGAVAVGPPPRALPDDRDEADASQRVAYASGQALLARQIETLQRKVETLQRQRDGVLGRRATQERMLAMARQELDRLQPLAAGGYVPRNRLAERRRTVLELDVTIAALTQEARGLADQIVEVRTETRRVRAAAADTAAKEYARVVGEMAEITDQLSAARAALGRTVLRAPVDGTVALRVPLAPGTIIGSGERIVDIVPPDALLLEARVEPADIDHIAIGQRAEVVVTAFDRRLDDPLAARIVYRAADIETDERTGSAHFTVRLAIDADARRAADVRAGMQAEVYLGTGGRTFMSYLMAPITDSFRKAFRER